MDEERKSERPGFYFQDPKKTTDTSDSAAVIP